MDPKTNMPDIKAEVNKVESGDKKKSSGLLGSLFGGGGSGAGGLGGLGGGAAAGGGLLATKAGLIALVVMGTAAAGGLGLAGYKIFGPSEADRIGGNVQVFQTKPKEQADPNAAAPVAADGSSASLNYLAQAAAKDKQADATPTDQTAGDAAKAAADEAAKKAAEEAAAKNATAAAGNTPINSGGGVGATGSMSHLNGVKKLGALSGVSGGGGGSTASAGPRTAGPALGDANAAAKNGASSSFSRGGAGAKSSLSAGRGIASRRGSGARNQLASVMRDQRGAGSSSAAGATYDGGRAGSNDIGAGNGIGMDGAGSGGTQQPKSIPGNQDLNSNKQEQIPEPPPRDVTPWANQLMMGIGLGAAAVAMLYFASSMMKDAKKDFAEGQAMLSNTATAAAGLEKVTEALTKLQLVRVLIGVAILASLAGLALGVRIATGEFGQKLQGGLLAASSTAIGVVAAMMMASASDPLPDAKDVKADTQIKGFSSPPTWMYICGGLGACGLAAAMLAPKSTCKSNEAGCTDHASLSAPAAVVSYRV